MTQFEKGIPINITGGSYESRSRPLSSQMTRNFYPQYVEQGKEQFILHSFPGLRLIGSTTGADRGMDVMAEKGYRICGETLYEFAADGTHTSLGTIAGSARCVMANDGYNLVIVADSNVYQYNTLDGLTEITDSNIQGSTAVTFINSQMLYTNNNLFVVSDVGFPSTANGLNAAAAESQPDDLIRAYSFQQSVYMFGERSVEPWWNTGVGFPPFQRMDGQIIEVGCQALHSIANTDEYIYWLGDDNAVYIASGGQKKRISTEAITYQIEQFTTTSDAIGYTCTIAGSNFYVLNFPTENKTFAVSEKLLDKGWFELSSDTSGGIYQGSSLVHVYGNNYVADNTTGELFILDLNTYMNGSSNIQRVRTTSSVNSKLFGKQGLRVQMSRLEIIMETGVGVISGQGENPKIIMDISYDGGRSWKAKGFTQIGRLGDNIFRAELYCLDSFYDAIFRLTIADPVPVEIYSAAIDLRLAGW